MSMLKRSYAKLIVSAGEEDIMQLNLCFTSRPAEDLCDSQKTQQHYVAVHSSHECVSNNI